jgi:hypothetical protein
MTVFMHKKRKKIIFLNMPETTFIFVHSLEEVFMNTLFCYPWKQLRGGIHEHIVLLSMKIALRQYSWTHCFVIYEICFEAVFMNTLLCFQWKLRWGSIHENFVLLSMKSALRQYSWNIVLLSMKIALTVWMNTMLCNSKKLFNLCPPLSFLLEA